MKLFTTMLRYAGTGVELLQSEICRHWSCSRTILSATGWSNDEYEKLYCINADENLVGALCTELPGGKSGGKRGRRILVSN
ncbi:hypothetical protein M8C21_024775 [Ambrosia artemisiifolia]|uniref:Uncharacterized protein n=1 Tax=Ambrosia artemisiifolia TaxID=4212 RepID=A0AAD5G275_AMBAR|nr:hypothetical protein M8C21_024775 [Ambrosia artemisiifolia]